MLKLVAIKETIINGKICHRVIQISNTNIWQELKSINFSIRHQIVFEKNSTIPVTKFQNNQIIVLVSGSILHKWNPITKFNCQYSQLAALSQLPSVTPRGLLATRHLSSLSSTHTNERRDFSQREKWKFAQKSAQKEKRNLFGPTHIHTQKTWKTHENVCILVPIKVALIGNIGSSGVIYKARLFVIFWIIFRAVVCF